MSYWFVSHASKDNQQLLPVITALLKAGVPLWFDRPYEVGLVTSRVAGYIREGEPWTVEILEALVQSSGIVCFPSAASQASDECRLELALGRTFNIAVKFPIIPVLLDEDSWRHMDPRISQSQGRRIGLVRHDDGNGWSLAPGADANLVDLAMTMRRATLESSRPTNVLEGLFNRFAKAAGGRGRVSARSAYAPKPAHKDSEFLSLVARYRMASTPEQRRALDDAVIRAPPIVSLSDVSAALDSSDDEAVAMAAAISLAGVHPSDPPLMFLDLASELLRRSASRVRYRVALALRARVRARLLERAQRAALLAIVEPALALERDAQVSQTLLMARDEIAGSG